MDAVRRDSTCPEKLILPPTLFATKLFQRPGCALTLEKISGVSSQANTFSYGNQSSSKEFFLGLKKLLLKEQHIVPGEALKVFRLEPRKFSQQTDDIKVSFVSKL